MKIVFGEAQTEEEKESQVVISNEDVKKKLDRLLARVDQKVTSLSALRNLRKADENVTKTEDLTSHRNSVNNKLAEDFGLEFNATKADFDLHKLLRKVTKLRGLEADTELCIMFCGDGRSVRLKHKSVALCLVILNEKDNVHKHTHVHQIGVYNTAESYKDFKECTKRTLKAIDDISADGIDGVPCKLFLGGDMKFIHMMTGLFQPGALKKCTCWACNVSEATRRKNKTTHTVNESRFTKRRGKDLKHPTLLPQLKVMNIVPDVLHLNLRVSGRLLQLFTTETFRTHGDPAAKDVLEDGMRAVLPRFSFFVRAEQVKKKNAWEAKCGYSPLRGPEFRRLMKSFHEVVEITHSENPERRDWLKDIWKRWKDMYDKVNIPPPEETAEERKRKAEALQSEIEAFVQVLNRPSIGMPGKPGFREGGCTSAQTSTNYFHMLFNHVHECMAEHGGLKRFTMQAVEFKNDSDGRLLTAGVSGRKAIVLAEILLCNIRVVLQEESLKEKEKTFECEMCGELLSSAGHLRRHCETTEKLGKEESESERNIERQHARIQTFHDCNHNDSDDNNDHRTCFLCFLC